MFNFRFNLPFHLRAVLVLFLLAAVAFAADLPSKRYINVAAMKTIVAAMEAEAKTRKVSVTICIVDDEGETVFLQKADGQTTVTLDFCRGKARFAALYGFPSKNAGEWIKNGNSGPVVFPAYFPAQGGVPIKIGEELVGGVAASGADSPVDEAIAQAGVDALKKSLQ